MTDAVLLALVACYASLAGHDDWSVREAATASLSAVACDWQLAALAAHHDPEIARRAGLVLRERRDDRLRRAVSQVERAIADAGLPPGVYPWIDSVPHDTVDRFSVVSPYLERAKDCGHSSNGPDFRAYREASRMWLADLLWDGAGVEGVADLARQMVAGDREQCRRCGYRWVGRN